MQSFHLQEYLAVASGAIRTLLTAWRSQFHWDDQALIIVHIATHNILLYAQVSEDFA